MSETCEITASKAMLCHALLKFINQRSGIEFGNYQCGDWKQTRQCFNGDYLPMLRHGRQARQLLQYVKLSGITEQQLIEATRAYSGRLQFRQTDDCQVSIDYTTGQYFPTEYRKAACAVLAQAIWDYWRDDYKTGDEIRKHARHVFGRSIASTWFN